MSSVHQVWPKSSCKAQWKGEEDEADRGRGGKTTSGNGQAWSSASPRGQWRTGKMEETGFEIICGAPTTLAVKGQMMMMMMIQVCPMWLTSQRTNFRTPACNDFVVRCIVWRKIRKTANKHVGFLIICCRLLSQLSTTRTGTRTAATETRQKGRDVCSWNKDALL